MRAALPILALAVVLAGCTAPAAQPAEAPTNGSTAGAPPVVAASDLEASALGGNASGPFDLHLHPDLTLAADPAAEGRVPLATPVNSPVTPGYPSWTGTLDRDVNLTREGVPVVLYVTTNSASVRANTFPAFADLPGMFLILEIGGKELHAQTDGEAVLLVGEVYEVQAVLQGATGFVAAGAEVVLHTGVIYSHVAGAAEYQFVMGPDHPARLTLPAT